jgi:hypothetical protein
LKVVVPSPIPHRVPMVVKRSAKSVRLTADPSQSSHPLGAALPPKATMVPVTMPIPAGP